jgi:soluble cytochrome b562
MPEETVVTERVETAATETDAGNDAQDADALKAELTEIRKALKKANAEAAERRKALEAYETAEKQRKEAEMSEVEKAQKQAAEIKAAYEALQTQLQTEKRRGAVTLAATAANFHNPADAFAFLADDAVTITDDGKVEGVDEAIEALKKARPYLVKAPAAGTQDIDANKRGTVKGKAQLDRDKVAAQFGIQVYPDE